MDCSEAKTHLSAFASGLTNDLDKGEIETHLAACEECSLEVELLRGRASGKATTPPPSDWTLDKIFGDDGQAGGSSSAGPGADASGSSSSEAPSREGPSSESVSSDATPSDATPSGSPMADPANVSEPAPAPNSMFGADEAPSHSPATASSGKPSMILPPPEPTADEPVAAKPKGKGKNAKNAKDAKNESWGFEPADASRETAPPEESVVFAEQALNRKQDTPKSKVAARRAIVWSLGGLAGLGLLGVSVWFAMAAHQAPTREVTTRPARSKPANGSAASPLVAAADSGAMASDLGSTPPDAVTPEMNTVPPSPTSDPGPTTTPATTAKAPSKGSATDRTLQARALSPSASMVPDPSRASSRPAQATPPSEAPKKPVSDAAPKAAAPTTAPATNGSSTTTTTTTSRPTWPPPKPLKHDDDDMWPTDDPVRPPAASTAPKTSAATTMPPAVTSGPKSDPPAATPKGSTPPAMTDASPTDAGSTTSKAIDRLHLATDKASADQDLASLRQLKTAWKGLLRTAVGKDRARAKREYADCLWDIQAITGRDADQREALNAYRDYLLSAPAGGADARSAERMRELEDALRERR